MLDIQSVTVVYGSNLALQGVSLQVHPGEVVALIGPNGAGKSSLIRSVSGVVPLAAGRVLSQDQDVAALSNRERARLLAVVAQARQLGGAFTVEQTVMLGRTTYMSWLGRPSSLDWQKVHQALEQTGLRGLENRRNAELSGGEQQRVMLARALAQSTPILLLDEPTNHLDLKHQANFLSLVRDLSHQQGLAVLMAMHDLNLVSLYADRVALVVEGILRAVGSPVDVLTVENISAAYQVPVHVTPHPEYGTPLVLPQAIREP